MADRHDLKSIPTIQNINGTWRVTYGDSIKEHHQQWQAEWYYQQAMRDYLAAGGCND